MDCTERFYRIDQLLQEKRVVPIAAFLENLGVSTANFKRDLEYLRDRFNAPYRLGLGINRDNTTKRRGMPWSIVSNRSSDGPTP